MERVVHEAEGRGSRDGSGLRRTQGLQSKANGRREYLQGEESTVGKETRVWENSPGGTYYVASMAGLQ